MAVGVSVDQDFARFGTKSYAINKINTVEVRERQPHGRGGAVLAALVGVFAIIVGASELSQPDDNGAGTIVIGLIIVGIAVWLWKRSNIVEYQLFLMTSSSEAQAYVSRDREEIYGLRDTIEAAMTGRS